MKFSCSRLVQEEGHIRVTLEDAGWQVRGDRSFNQSVNSISFLFAVSHEDDFLSGHDGSNPHTVGLSRHVFDTVEEALVSLNSGWSQID